MGLQNPGVLSSQLPAGEDHVMRRIKDIERFLQELTPSIARSIQPTVARLDATDVDLIAKQAAIAANVASINALLAQVVLPQKIYADATNFAITTAYTVKASTTITVPAGFTQAVVAVTARVLATNSNATGGINAGSDSLYCKASIAGDVGRGLPVIVLGSGSWGVNVSPFSTVLTGLTPGSTFTVTANAMAFFQPWATNTNNEAEVSGTILWLK
jgi:hypothetical protein